MATPPPEQFMWVVATDNGKVPIGAFHDREQAIQRVLQALKDEWKPEYHLDEGLDYWTFDLAMKEGEEHLRLDEYTMHERCPHKRKGVITDWWSVSAEGGWGDAIWLSKVPIIGEEVLVKAAR